MWRARIVRRVLAAGDVPPGPITAVSLEVGPAARAASLLREQRLDGRGRVDDAAAGAADDGGHVGSSDPSRRPDQPRPGRRAAAPAPRRALKSAAEAGLVDRLVPG